MPRPMLFNSPPQPGGHQCERFLRTGFFQCGADTELEMPMGNDLWFWLVQNRDYLMFNECRRVEKSLSKENPRVGEAIKGTFVMTSGRWVLDSLSPGVSRGEAEAHSKMDWPEVM